MVVKSLFTLCKAGAPEAPRPPKPQSWCNFEKAIFISFQQKKKFLKIGLKLAEIEAKMYLHLRTVLSCNLQKGFEVNSCLSFDLGLKAELKFARLSRLNIWLFDNFLSIGAHYILKHFLKSIFEMPKWLFTYYAKVKR